MYVGAELHCDLVLVIPAAFFYPGYSLSRLYRLNYDISAFPKSVKCIKVLL